MVGNLTEIKCFELVLETLESGLVFPGICTMDKNNFSSLQKMHFKKLLEDQLPFWVYPCKIYYMGSSINLCPLFKKCIFRSEEKYFVYSCYCVTNMCLTIFSYSNHTYYLDSLYLQASSYSDFQSHLSLTWSCFWSDGDVCSHVTVRLWVTCLATSLVILTQLLVLSSSDGAVFLSLLAVLTIPLGKSSDHLVSHVTTW